VTAVHEAPSDYPGGKKGDILTVEFTVLGIPCLGLNGGPTFKHSESNGAEGSAPGPIGGLLLSALGRLEVGRVPSRHHGSGRP
jgi:hypothetical protein